MGQKTQKLVYKTSVKCWGVMSGSLRSCYVAHCRVSRIVLSVKVSNIENVENFSVCQIFWLILYVYTVHKLIN